MCTITILSVIISLVILSSLSHTSFLKHIIIFCPTHATSAGCWKMHTGHPCSMHLQTACSSAAHSTCGNKKTIHDRCTCRLHAVVQHTPHAEIKKRSVCSDEIEPCTPEKKALWKTVWWGLREKRNTAVLRERAGRRAGASQAGSRTE
jgi:hypothetical protein